MIHITLPTITMASSCPPLTRILGIRNRHPPPPPPPSYTNRGIRSLLLQQAATPQHFRHRCRASAATAALPPLLPCCRCHRHAAAASADVLPPQPSCCLSHHCASTSAAAKLPPPPPLLSLSLLSLPMRDFL